MSSANVVSYDFTLNPVPFVLNTQFIKDCQNLHELHMNTHQLRLQPIRRLLARQSNASCNALCILNWYHIVLPFNKKPTIPAQL